MRQRPTVVSTMHALAVVSGSIDADADARVDRDLVVVVRHAHFFGRRVDAAEVAAFDLAVLRRPGACPAR